VNDEFGHRTGDKCLCEIVNRVRSSLRKVDFLARYGGEEFVAILPGTTRQNASMVAEKLRQHIERTAFLFQGKRVPVTISLGVTQVESSDTDPQSIFARADEYWPATDPQILCPTRAEARPTPSTSSR
jgi:diguanylate cyclase